MRASLKALRQRESPAECANTQLDLFNHSVVQHTVTDSSSLCLNHAESARCTMQARQIKGLRIAASSHIEQDGKSWLLPSQSSNKKYIVRYGRRERTCTCLDFESRRQPCKHIHAVAAKLDPQPITEIP